MDVIFLRKFLAFRRSLRIMTASRAPRLTILAPVSLSLLALVRFDKAGTEAEALPALQKSTAQPSLATATQSCILPAHTIRRLSKLPDQKDD
jgi:hypothetical protein